MHRHAAYGLTLISEIALPGLLPPDDPPGPEVAFRFGAVPPALKGAERPVVAWQVKPGLALMEDPAGTRYLIRSGREIVIDRAAGASDDMVRTYLLGSALAALLHQRGIYTLHASAVEIGGRAVLFSGVSGTGKSTLAAGLAGQGYPMIADDVAGLVSCESGEVEVLPAFPLTRLWEDGVRRIAADRGAIRRVRPEMDKFHVPAPRFAAAPVPVGAVYFLSVHNRPEIEIAALTPVEGIQNLTRFDFRGRVARILRPAEAGFRVVTQLARDAALRRLLRPASGGDLAALVARVLDDLGASAGPRTARAR